MERKPGFAALEPPLGGGVTGEAGGQRYPEDHGDHDGAKSGGTGPTEGWKVGVKSG